MNGEKPKGPRTNSLASLTLNTIPVNIETISKIKSANAGMNNNQCIFLTNVYITWPTTNGVALYLMHASIVRAKRYFSLPAVTWNSIKTIIDKAKIDTIKTKIRLLVLLSINTVVITDIANASKTRINAQFCNK